MVLLFPFFYCFRSSWFKAFARWGTLSLLLLLMAVVESMVAVSVVTIVLRLDWLQLRCKVAPASR